MASEDYIGPANADFPTIQKKFLSIVLGDVIFYGAVKSGTYTGHHIGEIANVDYSLIQNATTLNQLLQAVTVIECVFNGKVNYVIKRSMFATGSESNPLSYTTDTAGSWKFSTKKWNEALGIQHLRNWEIRRLNAN